MNFDKSLFDNCRENILVCAHRGSSGGNIPCNTLAAFNAALIQGADMIELDVTKTKDGKLFVFHPGMEPAHLKSRKYISNMTSDNVFQLRYVNQDDTKTFLGVNTLEEILSFLKGKCYINIDKFWDDIPGITEAIRKCGVEKQVVVKTAVNKSYIESIKKYASDLMFMPIVKHADTITDYLRDIGINCIGAEVIYENENEEVCSDEYIDKMHQKGMIVFTNSIVYDSTAVLAAGHSDDNAFLKNPDYSWGWLAEKNFDIIQTDWAGTLKQYLLNRSK